MPDESFSFRDLIKPGQGAKAALEKEVERRAKMEKYTPGRWYGGLGEMLKAHGTYFTGSVLPDEYDDVVGQMTLCHQNTLDACEARPELRYFTGLYSVGPKIAEHSWAVDPDGKVIEVTYPTKGEDTKIMRLPEYPHGEEGPAVRGSLGWTPPSTWAYVGLEFDTSFVRRWFDQTQLLPLLNGHDDMPGVGVRPFLKAYSPRGFSIPDDIEMETCRAQVLARFAADDGWDGDEDDDNPEEPEFV